MDCGFPLACILFARLKQETILGAALLRGLCGKELRGSPADSEGGNVPLSLCHPRTVSYLEVTAALIYSFLQRPQPGD